MQIHRLTYEAENYRRGYEIESQNVINLQKTIQRLEEEVQTLKNDKTNLELETGSQKILLDVLDFEESKKFL